MADIDSLRQAARELCLEHQIAVLPYGPAWWLVGDGVSRVVGELAGLSVSDLTPLPMGVRL